MKKLVSVLEKSGCKKVYESGNMSVFYINVSECPIFGAKPKLFPFAVIENGNYIDSFASLQDAVTFLNCQTTKFIAL